MKKYILLIVSVITFSCTDLNLSPADAFVDAVVFQDASAYRSYLAKVYAAFTLTGQQGGGGDPDISIVNDEGFTSYIRAYWKAQELTTDEAVISWTDAGIRDLNTISWSSENQFVRVLYYRIFYIIAYSNDFLGQSSSEKLDEYGISEADKTIINTYRAEVRFLRAMAYWHALDLFRNVPLLTKITTDLPSQVSPTDLFSFIETELNDIEKSMVAPMMNEYGRADQGALWMLQAKLYLNSEVYTGQTNYDKVISAVDKITAAGYALHPNYFELFLADNHFTAAPYAASPETIFSITSDGKNSQAWGNTTFLVSAGVGGTMGDNLVDGTEKVTGDGTEVALPDEALNTYGIGGGWAGMRTTRGMVEKFGPDPTDISTMDPRNIFYTNGQSLEISDVGEFNEGYAVPKFKNITAAGDRGSDPSFPDTDNPIFRLADAYLMYAEANLRGGGGDRAKALQYVNALRIRAYGDTSGNITDGDLTLNFILDERVRELYWESTRRVDLIRFGLYTGGSYLWPWKGGDAAGSAVSEHYEIFPIPASDLNVNSKLKQNDNY